METAFLLQPWITTRTIKDYCRLCYQSRDGKDFMQCKRAHLAGSYSLLGSLRMEAGQEFGDALKNLEDAKETCLSMGNPDSACHEKMQKTLESTQALYDRMLDDYKSKYAVYPSKLSPTPRM